MKTKVAPRRDGYAAVHRETGEILFVEWTKRNARYTLDIVVADPHNYRIERVKVVSYVLR